MSFADNVKKARVGLGLTQETLGQLVGVSGQAVSKWETAVSHTYGYRNDNHTLTIPPSH